MSHKVSQDKLNTVTTPIDSEQPRIIINIIAQLKQTQAIFRRKNLENREPPLPCPLPALTRWAIKGRSIVTLRWRVSSWGRSIVHCSWVEGLLAESYCTLRRLGGGSWPYGRCTPRMACHWTPPICAWTSGGRENASTQKTEHHLHSYPGSTVFWLFFLIHLPLNNLLFIVFFFLLTFFSSWWNDENGPCIC